MELTHHGILGMKWGDRNGPPYPLDASDHSASEKKAGWRKSLDNTDQATDNTKKSHELTDKQKKAIAIGAIAVTAALATYGAYKLGAFDNLSSKSKSLVNGLLDGDLGKAKVSDITDSVSGFKKMTQKETIADAITKVNPSGSHNNCYNVVTATAARLCGLDVTAKGDTQSGNGLSFDDICKVFKLNPDNDSDVLRVMRPSVESITRQITKRFSEGDVGAIGLEWNDAYKKAAGVSSAGHTLNWTIANGKVEFLDGQAKISGSALKQIMMSYLDSGKEASIAKFANTMKGLDLNTDVDLDLFRKFVN